MLTARAARREDGSTTEEDEDDIAMSDTLSTEEKREMLQRALNMAASNGDVERIRRLVDGKARAFVDFNAPDEDGTAPLIYASCFVRFRKQERGRWSVADEVVNPGTSGCRFSIDQCWRRCGRSRSKSMESIDVGHDQST